MYISDEYAFRIQSTFHIKKKELSVIIINIFY